MADCGIGDVGWDVAKCIFQEIKRHVRYVFVYKKNVEKFEEKMKSLMAKREAVQLAVETAERNVEKMRPHVKLWCDRVGNAINEDVKKVKDLEDKAKNKCFFDLCPNIKSRYQLSKKAEEGAAAVDELLQQDGLDKVGYRDVPGPPEASKNFRAFDSRQEIFGRVIEALKDSTTSMIGVYGTGGVGKTTLVNEVARRVREDNLFGWVAKATVTRTPNIEKIQGEIAESLQLELKEESIQERARLLLARLKQEKKKILIVLDDIWAELDLEQVGIPFGDQREECKILLTSRNRHVLTNEMGVKNPFAIDVLNETEAWNLFKEMAGNNFEDLELQPVATKVAKKCEGLPVAIVTVARALKGKNIYAWKDAFVQLQRPSPSNFTGIPAAVYSAIELSYNYLESKELKQTFLLCGFLGHNARVEDLVRFAMGLHLFDDVVNTVGDTRNRVLTLVSNLKAFCLLRDSYSHKRFDMHDFDCDVALAIASRDNHAFGVFDDWPDEERMRKFKMISLSFDSVEKLPHQLECPQLDFFHMGSKDSDVEMPAKFFEKMKNLEVLDLLKMKFSSINLPTSLRALCLNQCVLGDMINLGKLKNLEIFSLIGCSSVMLPKEIGQLTKLRLLDLRKCYELIIPAGVLSSLSKLEELYIGESFVEWDQRSNARLAELKALSGLTTLNVCIPDADIVLKDFFSEKLQRYKILIGWTYSRSLRVEYSRILKLKVNTSIDNLDDGVLRLLKKTEALYLEGLQGVKIVLNNPEGFLHLKHLEIQAGWEVRGGREIQYIMNDNDAIDKIAFHQLRSLTLKDLPKLISFCSRNESGGSTSTPQRELALFGEEMDFPCLEDLTLMSINVERLWPDQFSIRSDYAQSLTSLSIWNCDNLKHILSFSMAKSLTHLKSFEVRGCNCLREIIFTEDIEEDMMDQIFPKLELLKLEEVPNLTRFCHGSYCEFPLLKELIIRDCPTFKTFISKSTVVNENHIKPSKWPLLKRMEVCGCDKVEIFASENLLSLRESTNQQPLFWVSKDTFSDLEELTLEKNGIMKEIWHGQLKVECVEVKGHIVFNRLKHLKLRCLPTLVSFYSGDQIFEFPALEKVIVTECPKMKIFCQGDFSTPKLQKVISKESGWRVTEEVWWEGDLKTIIKQMFEEKVGNSHLRLSDDASELIEMWKRNPQGILTFKHLEVLEVDDCSTLSSLFTLSTALGLPQLRELIVKNCIVMEHIIIEEGSDEQVANKTVFLLLRSITLESCENLASFYQGSKTLECPSLEKVNVYGCPKMLAFASAFSREQRLEIIDEGNTTSLSKRIVDTVFFDNTMDFPCLAYLSLWDINVERIWPNQISIRSDYAQTLTSLRIWNCDNLKHLLSSSMAKSLAHLKIFYIYNCKCLREVIFTKDIEEDMMGLIFPKLEHLRLEDLPKLTRFCHASYCEFPLLEELTIRDCPTFETFISKSTMVNEIHINPSKWPSLKKIEVYGCDKVEIFASENLLSFGESTNQQPLFWVNEVTFPNLEELTLKKNGIMKEIWHGQLREECDEVKGHIVFNRLKHLKLSCLPTLVSFCLGDQIFEFPTLKKVIVTECPMMKNFCQGDLSTRQLHKVISKEGSFDAKEIWWWEGDLKTTIKWMFEEKIGYGHLKLSDTSELIEIWSRNPQEISSFKSLESLEVHDCSSLRWLFTHSMALGLSQLRLLEVKNCIVMEHIVKEEGPDEQVASFYQGNKILKFPSLEYLEVVGCPQMFAFASVFSREQRIGTIHDIDGGNTTRLSKGIVDTAFFGNTVAFPHLDFLYFESMRELRKIWDDKVTMNSFCNLEYLEVKDCQRLSNIFPFNMMERLQKLESLKIVNCDSLEEIIGPQRLNSNESNAVTAIELRLSELPELTHLSKEEISLGEVVFSNLRWLKVSGCGKLKNLVPSSVSLKNLTALKVSKCHGLRNLVTLPVARSMVLLWRMSITDCQMLEEIIASTSDEVMDGIIFSKLWSLELGGLPSLSRFCSGNYMLGFPSLENVIMRQCPKMEIFSKGELSTPILQGIQSTEGEYVGCWEGNLNATIQRLFIQKVFSSLEDLERSAINIQRIWHYKLLAQHSYAQNLTCLTMEGCHNLNTLFSTSMVESFVQLKMLKIENCENVEKVVLIEGLANEEMMRQRLFRRLEFLLLKDLPRLTRFCHGNYFEFPLVRTLRIEGCPTLKTFISDAEGNSSEIASPTLFNEKVKFPCLEELSIVGRGNWGEIGHVQSTHSVRIHFANN